VNAGIVTNWSNRPPRFPWVTLTIFLLCLVVKIGYTFSTLTTQELITNIGAVIPSHITQVLALPLSEWTDRRILTLFSALFIHASWLHLVGNMIYLWVFGIPLERRVGSAGMLLVFLLGGALANLSVCLRLPEMGTSIIGSSGAVSAVVGAYLGLFPFRRIGMLLPLGLYLQFARVPSILVIGSWFTLQLVYTMIGPITGVVAWWTHMAGFTLGLMFALMMRAAAQIRFG
jgi:membrane associated rhomboid family serine protease